MAIGAGSGGVAGVKIGDVAGGAAGAGSGAGAAASARFDGGSNSSVYSRTSLPLVQVSSRITSTNGSCTARSLVNLR